MLLKGPQLKDTFTFDLTFTSSARNAWLAILRHQALLKHRPINLLVPAYIGQSNNESGIFDPIRSTLSSYEFYPVSDRLVPDMSAIEESILQGEIDLLLIVHYFGFVRADLAKLKTLCSTNGVLLVEDCAHCCFTPTNQAGSVGDFSYYSLHKFFPTETGGILRSNCSTSSASLVDENARCKIDVLEQISRTDITAVIQKRRDNYQYLENAIINVRGITPFWKLDTRTIPHDFPILVSDNRRENLYFHLKDRGLVTIALYYRLVDEIDAQLYPASFGVSNNILNLPIHQDTSRQDLDALVYEIGQFIES